MEAAGEVVDRYRLLCIEKRLCARPANCSRRQSGSRPKVQCSVIGRFQPAFQPQTPVSVSSRPALNITGQRKPTGGLSGDSRISWFAESCPTICNIENKASMSARSSPEDENVCNSSAVASQRKRKVILRNKPIFRLFDVERVFSDAGEWV